MALVLLVGGSYFALQSSKVQTYLTQLIANYFSKQTQSKISVGKVNITFFSKLKLEDVLIEDQQNDTLFYTRQISASIDTLKIKKKRISLDNLSFNSSKIIIKKDTLGEFNFSKLIESLQGKKDTTGLWKINCNNFGFYNSNILYNDQQVQKEKSFFVNNLNFDISQFQLYPDSILFKLNNLFLDNNKQLYVDNLSADFAFVKNKISVDKFNLRTHESFIRDAKLLLDFGEKETRDLSSLEIDFRFPDSEINLSDVAQLVPSLKGMNDSLRFSGQIYGNLTDLRGKDLIIKTKENLSADLDFYINDLSDVENMYLFIDIKRLNANFSDINQITLPESSSVRHINFPSSFYEAGNFTYKGNLTGFLSDFVAYGTLTSDMGILTTDVSVTPNGDGTIKYKGAVETGNFNLGELFQLGEIGKLTFNGNVDGDYNKNNHSISGIFKGNIDEIEVHQYVYKNITLDGTLDNKRFDGLLSIDDPNLKFDFSGSVNLNPEIPVFNFTMMLDKALAGKLNFSKNFPAAEMAFYMTANFEGDKLDNLKGTITLEDGIYKNRNGTLNLNLMELRSVPNDSVNALTFTSDFFDVEILGDYHFQSIINAFEKSANFYLPATNYEKLSNAADNIFDYEINVKNLDSLTAVFSPGYQIETPFILYGGLDSKNTEFKLEGSIPSINSEKLIAKNIFIGNRPLGEEYSSKFRIGEIYLNNEISLYNLTVDSKIADNIISNKISWDNEKDSTYTGFIETRTEFTKPDSTEHPHIEIEGLPSSFYIGDSIWQISPFTATIDSTAFEVNNLDFSLENQKITIDGKISENKSDIFSATFENIDLKQLNSYFTEETSLNGILDGSAGIFDFYGEKMILSDLGIKDFQYKDQNLGNVSLSNYWDNINSVLNTDLKINLNDRESLVGTGTYTPSGNVLDYTINTDSLSLVILETVIRNNISDFHGFASGKVRIHGTPDKILMDGALLGSNASLMVDYTQVNYHFNDSVYFKGDTILFDRIPVFDPYNNRGIFNGTIIHDNFSDMKYNLSLSSPKILALNTSLRDNEQFFGRVFTNGRFNLIGDGKNVNLSGSGTTLSETNVNISLEYESEIEQYDFIQFVSNEEKNVNESKFPLEDEGNFNLNLTINVTPEAQAQLIYNSQIGDVIRARGEGILLFGMDNDGNITLSGDYTIEEGDYLFTLQNLINKRFTIEQGGTIVWSGSPYDANININAVYSLKASLYDLFLNQEYIEGYQNQRIPVDCKILLSENLTNPLIDFEIDFPTADTRTIDELQQYFKTEEEKVKQISFLLAVGKFYTPEYMRGTYEAQNTNIIGTTASELFSNQISNWLSKLSNDFDIGLNYRPGNEISNDEIELALSTQIFNDRVRINGNIGNNTNPNSINNNQLVGDFDISVKIIPSGKIQLKAYNRSNNNLIYETAPYTQGIGLSFKEEYNNIGDLLSKWGQLFKKDEDSVEQQ